MMIQSKTNIEDPAFLGRNHLSISKIRPSLDGINNHLAYANRLSSPNCRGVAFCEAGPFTTVENSLQISPFMQNEPNLPKAQMNVNKVLIKDYENKPNWTLGENEPKTNPIKANQSQFPLPTRRNKPNTNPIKPNTNPISTVTLVKWVIAIEHS